MSGVGSILMGHDKEYYDDNNWIVESLTDSFGLWESDKPFYGDKYLRFDENDCVYYLSEMSEEEEEVKG